MSGIVKSLETEVDQWLPRPQGRHEGEVQSDANRTVSFLDDENTLEVNSVHGCTTL